jgi:hypothetical protein
MAYVRSVPLSDQYSRWAFFEIGVGFIEHDKDFVGYIWIFYFITTVFLFVETN